METSDPESGPSSVDGDAGGSGKRAARRWWPWFRDLALVLGILLGVRACNAPEVPAGSLPELAGEAVDGTQLSLAQLRGEPVMVHFWASWCGVCHMVESSVQALAGEHRVLSVASRSGAPAKVLRYMQEKQLDFPVINDPSGQIARSFGVRAYPSILFLHPDGSLATVEVGYTTELGMRLRMWWSRLF